MINAIMRFVYKVHFKIFSLLLGLSIGAGGLILAQICPRLGQCANCAACLAGLPLLAILILAGKKRGKILSLKGRGCITNVSAKRSKMGIITKGG